MACSLQDTSSNLSHMTQNGLFLPNMQPLSVAVVLKLDIIGLLYRKGLLGAVDGDDGGPVVVLVECVGVWQQIESECECVAIS